MRETCYLCRKDFDREDLVFYNQVGFWHDKCAIAQSDANGGKRC